MFISICQDGVPYNSERALEMVQKISQLENAQFTGLYTHSDASYHCKGAEEIEELCQIAWGRMDDLANRLVQTLGDTTANVSQITP